MGGTADFKSNDPQTVCDFVSISENENLYAAYGAFSLAFIPTILVALAGLRVCQPTGDQQLHLLDPVSAGRIQGPVDHFHQACTETV